MTGKKLGIVLAKPPGYSETFFRSKIRGLKLEGFEVSLFCQENIEDFDLCPIYTSPRKQKNVFFQLVSILSVFSSLLGAGRNVINFARLEKEEGTSSIEILKKIYLNAHILKSDLDWLHYGFATLALKRELLAKSIGAKMAVSFRGFDLDVYPLKHPNCYSLLWTKLDKVHSISLYLLEKAYSIGMPASIEYNIINPAVSDSILRDYRKQDRKFNSLKIVTIARLHWIKGIDLLIKTAQQLKQQKLDFEWIIIGGGDQKEEERYRFHIYEADLVEEVKLVGKLSHIDTLRLLGEADIYVQTSWSEGFCNAILEAQALGIPSCAFNVGGIPENIEDYNTGFLVTNHTSKGMARKIFEIFELPVEEVAKVSQAAKDKVAAKYTMEEQQREFRKFYT